MATLGLTACQTTKSYFAGARIVTKGNPVDEVQNEVIDAFVAEGFNLASDMGSRMVFEKAGSRNDEWMYGGWGKGKHTQQRAVVTVEMGDEEGVVETRCKAQIVRDYGGMMGEEKGVLWASGRHRFQAILDDAKKELRESVRLRREREAR